MVNRLFKISLFTGAAHLFTLITLKYVTGVVSVTELSLIGEIDSLSQFLIYLIGFGLQLSAVRYIATTENWKKIYVDTQQARVSLSMLLMPLALLGFINPVYLLFLFTPIFALSGDYALYATGRPVTASAFAFFRVAVPSVVLVVFSIWFPTFTIAAFFSSIILIYWLTGIMISKRMNTGYLYKPDSKSLILYFQSYHLGLVTVATYIISLGLIILAGYLFIKPVIAVAYLGLKLLVIFKGFIRIINQAFIKEMVDDGICLKVDRIAMLAGFSFFALIAIFPGSFIELFFNDQYLSEKLFFILIGFTAFISSNFTSLSTRSMLKLRDKPYAWFSVFAASLAIVILIVSSFFFQSAISIAVSACTGELVITAGLVILNRDASISKRVIFLLHSLPALLIPVLARLIMGDSLIGMFTGFLLFITVLFMIHYKTIISLFSKKILQPGTANQ